MLSSSISSGPIRMLNPGRSRIRSRTFFRYAGSCVLSFSPTTPGRSEALRTVSGSNEFFVKCGMLYRNTGSETRAATFSI